MWSYFRFFIISLMFSGILTGVMYSQSIKINEVMASNGVTISDEDGDLEDWIELLNAGIQPVSLGGLGLSDDYDNPFRWIFPDTTIQPGEFFLIWASGKDRTIPGQELHTNFSIDSDGEELILTDANGVRIDELVPTSIPRDISYGRQPDGSDDWFYFMEPTPGAPNTTQAFKDQLSPPSFSQTGGFFPSSFDLSIETEDTNAVIYYTLDGSEPTDTSLRYEGPIYVYDRDDIPNDISEIPTNIDFTWRSPGGPVNKIMAIRARVFREGYIPSETKTHSYVVDPNGSERYTMPVVSLTTERDNFFADTIGIYVPGIHHVPHPDRPVHQQGNFTQRGRAWERPVHFEYFDKDGARVFAQHAGVRIHGAATRSLSQKSLRMYARSSYDDDWFEYPFFIDKDLPRSKRFILRNSGNVWESTMFRDIMIQQLVRELDLDYQSYRPVIVFLNGEYWGIHNIRERIDKYYFETNYNIDPEDIDLLTGFMEVKEGDRNHYQNLRTFLLYNDITEFENYEYVQTQMDISNFINYNITQIYVGNTDWPSNNIDYWRQRTPDGRWRWVLYDTDFGFGLYGGKFAYEHNTLAFATATDGPSWPNPPWSTFMLRTLLKNDVFQERFISRFADLINTTFDPARVNRMIDTLQNAYQPEIEEHQHRWYPHHSLQRWIDHVIGLREFAEKRPHPVREHIIEYFELEGLCTLTVEVNNPKAGAVQVNSILIDTEKFVYSDSLDSNYWEGVYFKGVPVTFTPKAYPGYTFGGWGKPDTDGDTLVIIPGDSVHITANFIWEGDFSEDPMNPEPYDLSNGPYRFNYWPADKPEGTFPPHMVFLHSDMTDPGLKDEMTDIYHIPEGEYHGDDIDNVGYPYRLTRRTRLTGWNAEGITFINTGRDRDLGTAMLALNTTGQDSIMVSWTAGTIQPNSRKYAIRLQYRIGAHGQFKNVIDSTGEIVEYIRHDTARHFRFMEPVLLPDEVNDQPYVQIRWKYYHVSGTGGPRAKLLLDNILVTAGDHPHTLFPEPFDLSQGAYEFNYWNPGEPESTFPPNMVFLQTRMDDPGINDDMVEPYHIPFYNEDNNAYHANDHDKFGYPYMLTGRTRITGLEDDGISFINTGRGRDLGAAVLALNTTDRKDVTITWSGGTIIPNSRAYNIRLRYRIGTKGPFQNVLDNGSRVEYSRSAIPDFDKVIGPVTLPQDVHDIPYVQIKWKYYYTGERIDPDVGRRDMLRLGNITVTSRSIYDEEEDEPEIPQNYYIEQNFPNPFNPSTTIRYGLPEHSLVKITIYSVLGEKIATIINEEQPAGIREVEWVIPRQGIASGVYYYRIEAAGMESTDSRFTETKPMVIVK